MKKIAFYLTLLSLIMIFAGCQHSTNDTPSDEENENTYTYSPAQIAELKAIYAKLVGTTWENSDSPVCTHTIESASFADDSVTFNNVQYSLNQDTDLFFDNEVTDEEVKGGAPTGIYLYVNNSFYAIDDWILDDDGDDDEDLYIVSKIDGTHKKDFLRLTSSAGGNGDTSSVNGTYSFSDATGSQINGSITLSDENFTYSGDKSQAPSGGTYTVNGSDITFKWTVAGYETSTTVSMSKDGSSVTFSSSEVLFFSTFFGSTAQSGGKYTLTFTYSE